jgi:hypothetical protein
MKKRERNVDNHESSLQNLPLREQARVESGAGGEK